ncbi:ATP synthase subunit H-domain-containing protein [Chytriomyces sp. MP71]|nr:ATP synthase subunit H-domain-containing protein [Chytriomyces sp. MP71]
MGLLTIFISFLVYAGIGAVGFSLVPRGEDQFVYRTAVALTFTSTWLMWAITYLAQLNPLVVPERTWTLHHAGAGDHSSSIAGHGL